MAKKTLWTAKELKDRIKRRHPYGKGWYTTTEFTPASGQSDGRRMDAVAVALYRSHGFGVHGFEVKVSRSDWLHELRNPAKSSPGFEEMDYFWVVAPSTDIVNPNELPPKWGLFTCSGIGLRATIQPARLRPEDSKISRAFMASLLWRVGKVKTPSEKAIELSYHKGRTDARLEMSKRMVTNESVKGLRESNASLRGIITRFEKAADTPLASYNAEEVGAIVKLLTSRSVLWSLGSFLKGVQSSLKGMGPQVKVALVELAKLKKAAGKKG